MTFYALHSEIRGKKSNLRNPNRKKIIIIISQILQHQTQFIIITRFTKHSNKRIYQTSNKILGFLPITSPKTRPRHNVAGTFSFCSRRSRTPIERIPTEWDFHPPSCPVSDLLFLGHSLFFWRHTWHNPCIQPKKIMSKHDFLEFMIHHPAHKGAIATSEL